MKRTTNWMPGLFVVALTLAVATIKAQTKQNDKKEETPYTKLFKGKTVKTQRGLITLHQSNGKVYFEMPVKLLDKAMLLGSVAEEVSNSNDAAAGEQAHDPLCIYFTQIDSTVHIRKKDFATIAGQQEYNLEQALDKNYIDPILASFRILAVSPDSLAVVFDATSFFVSGNQVMDPFMPVGGLQGRKTSYAADKSVLADIMAYEDNVSISSYLSFNVTSTFFGFVTEQNRPSTILMKRSLLLLPEKPMRPRINDPRIGIFSDYFLKFSGKDNGMDRVYYAHRWRLEPSDVAAWKRGEKVTPVKPIVFYIDDKFPADWIGYIRQGVEEWNKAYEQAGFKNAVVTKMYPKNDPSFDPNNIRYNCIKYAPTLTQNAMGPSWVDPRTGEILSASIYVYHGIADVLNEWLFVQTAAADKRVRTTNIPRPVMGRALRYVIAHETGHCLGLMHNMGASSSFPVDSLRSPSFTQRYGTTPSIMDYARFNFVAQPGDMEKGVQLTPPELGVYDIYAIKWLYTPLYDAATPQDEVPVLDKWITEKIKDPMYRYGRQQLYGTLDPNAQTEDLGDDQVKATQYVLENLKYIMQHMDEWLAKEDADYEFRRKMNFSLINIQFYWYWMHVLSNLGGIYQYEKYEGDPFPAYKAVPEETQKKSLQFILQSLEDLAWTNYDPAGNNSYTLNGDAASYLRTVLFPYTLRWIARIGLSEAKADGNPYTREECIADVFDYVWASTLAGEKTSAEKLSMQSQLVMILIQNADVLDKPKSAQPAAAVDIYREYANNPVLQAESRMAAGGCLMHNELPLNLTDSMDDISGFGYLPRIQFQATDMSHIYYEWLLKCKTILEKAVTMQDEEVKEQYEYLLFQVKRALKN